MHLSKGQVLTLYDFSAQAHRQTKEIELLLGHNQELNSIPSPVVDLIKANITGISSLLQEQQSLLSEILNGSTDIHKGDNSCLIDCLGLSDKATNLLKRNGISTLSSLISFLQFHSLTEFRGCGIVMAEKIERALELFLQKEEGKKG